MKSLGLPQFRNKMEKEKQGQLANPGSPGKRPLRQWFLYFFLAFVVPYTVCHKTKHTRYCSSHHRHLLSRMNSIISLKQPPVILNINHRAEALSDAFVRHLSDVCRVHRA